MNGRANQKVSLTLTILMVLCLTTAQAWGKYGGGGGTAENPYLIYTAEQMNTIGLHPEDWDKHFKLMADIDLGGFTGTSYNIIGGSGTPFTGVFDGNIHKILDFNYSSTSKTICGLFGAVGVADIDEGEIKNVILINPHVDVGKGIRVGSLAARVYNGIISHCCAVGGSVSGGDFGVGGLVGIMEYGTMTNCYSTCDVSGSESCYVTGGLVGSIWRGKISYCFATGNVSGYRAVGGLMSGTNEATISNCYATGNVIGVENIGGLLGEIWDNKANIYNCYSTGKVSGKINVGGLIGVRYAGAVSKSFWDIETSGQAWSAGGTGKTTAEMQMKNTFTSAGWDFVTPIWTINEGNDYPRLWWEENILYVPGHYPTIQAAIDAAVNGDTVIVAPGTYTSDGNCDIDFLGKANRSQH